MEQIEFQSGKKGEPQSSGKKVISRISKKSLAKLQLGSQ